MAVGDLINIYRGCCSVTLVADSINIFVLCLLCLQVKRKGT